MPIYTVQGPDGKTYDIQGPDGATANQLGSFIQSQDPSKLSGLPTGIIPVNEPAKPTLPPGFLPINQDNPMQPTPQELAAQQQQGRRNQFSQFLQSQFDPASIDGVLAGEAAGAAKVGLGATHLAGKTLQTVGADSLGGGMVDAAASGRKSVNDFVAPFKTSAPFSTGAGELGSEILATLPVGGALAKGVGAVAPYLGKATPYAQKLAQSLRTGGANLGGAPATNFGQSAANLALRSAGGGATGAATVGLIDPDQAALGGAIGVTLPPAMKLTGAVANGLVNVASPFFESGQAKIAGNLLRQFSSDPQKATAQLQGAREIIPGSVPTAAMASGDTGIAGLTRAAQNSNPGFASDLAARETAQNQARTSALSDIAGNQGKMAVAKQARDDATAPLRESVLDAAGKIPSADILSSIDRLIAKPDNAGSLSQQTLNQFRKQIDQASQNGTIDSRALYAIRKDIGMVQSGKLQGDAGNARYAAGQLNGVKGIIDDAIDAASRRVPTPGTDLMLGGSNLSTGTMPNPGSTGPRPSWKDYLQTYTDQSVPINQMETLSDVMKRIQNGTVDKEGAPLLSAAKLNNLLKNEGDDLAKRLAPEQMDTLRRLSADLNASQLASGTGRAVGSNTMQNIAQNNLMAQALGRKLGGSSLMQTTLGRLLQLPYGFANSRIQDRLGKALLNSQDAAKLLADPRASALAQELRKFTPLNYRGATPALTQSVTSNP